MSTFYGISLNVLPKANFPRILLIVFIAFCLIIRTCYQSKLYEFMTTLMRRPPPKSLNDLIERNYTIFTSENYLTYKEMMNQEVGSNLKNISFDDFYDLYANHSQNGSIRVALAVSTVFQHFQESYDKKIYHWLELHNQYLYVRHLGFSYHANVFFTTMLHKTIEQFVEYGIIQHIFDENYDLKILHLSEPNNPTVLTLHELAFGFYIWLGTFGISILAFFIEIIVWMFKNNEKMKTTWSQRRQKRYISQVKHCKIYPSMFDEENGSKNLKSETFKKFHVQKNNAASE
ncbi:hypothetical protein ACKWTF_013339 [Chironomus riparius]